MSLASIELDDLTLGYNSHPAVHHLSGRFEAGSLTAIVGPNGAGKSTLLKGITGTLKPLGGSIMGAVGVSAEAAYLPQIAEIDCSFPARVTDLVSLGLWKQRGPFWAITRSDRQAIDDALSAVGLALAVTWRPLFAECLDPTFLRSVSNAGHPVHLAFLALVVMNLVGGFQALGTLMAVGLMVLPPAATRFWVRDLEAMCLLSILIGMASSYVGLLISFHLSVASGPAIILTSGAIYAVSLLFGTRGLLRGQPKRHRTA